MPELIMDGMFEVLPPSQRKRIVIEISEDECDGLLRELTPQTIATALEGRPSFTAALVVRVIEAFATQMPVRGVCFLCGCTDDLGCVGGCSWVDEDQTLCSACAERLRL